MWLVLCGPGVQFRAFVLNHSPVGPKPLSFRAGRSDSEPVHRNLLFLPFPQAHVTGNRAFFRQPPSNNFVSREKRYYVYILASKSRALYVGVTGFLTARILQHKAGEGASFARRYNINRLIYYESFQYVNNAITRETELKSWSRKRKVALIEAVNPLWDDLAEDRGNLVGMKQHSYARARCRSARLGMTKV